MRTCFALLVAAAAAHAQTALQATSTVNVRSGPGTTYSVVGQAQAGQRYVGLEKSGAWWKIWFDGQARWTHGGYYSTVTASCVKVNTAVLNVRSGPGTSYSIVGQVASGQMYGRISLSGGWAKIWFAGTERFVSASYVLTVTLGTSSIAGLDINAPVDGAGNPGENTNPDRIASTGTKWVRVNFIGDHFGAYDSIVNGILAKGIKIYLLVGSEAVGDPGDLLRSYPGPDSDAASAWIQSYAATFVAVVDHFKDRVRVFETYNEPNDWAGGTTHKVHPRWMAKILQELYLNTKHFNGHAGISAWQVTITSGPLFSFDLTTAADYLEDVYWYGKNAEAWDWTKAQTGSYPLDGIGYHMYVAQDPSQLGEIGGRMKSHLDAIWSVVTSYEGPTSKRIWVSEFGWTSAGGESFQAQALAAGFAALKADSRVALACWFSQVDFPGNAWGLYRMDWTAKPSRAAFQSVAP